MPPTPDQFARRITGILRSVQPLPDESSSPIRHYRRTVTDIWGSLVYVERLIAERERYQGVVDRHLGRLYGMALVTLIETFERFLKEVAADCVDRLADLVVDDRFSGFSVQGATIASHFGSGSPGKALCESSTWIDCKQINDRFKKLLADPFEGGAFHLFPNDGQSPVDQRWRLPLMSLVWQLRNTSVHNVGVITKSDAIRLRILARTKVEAPRMLVPERNDLRWLKAFLDDTAEAGNQRIGGRLAELLTVLHGETPDLIDPPAVANLIAATFRLPLSVAGVAGVVPPD